jgi:DNA-binding XRE family transcriptional regulator
MTSESLGFTIRQARSKARLSQGELAEEVGAADGTIWRVENETYTPSKTLTIAIAYTLGLEKAHLLALRSAAERAVAA